MVSERDRGAPGVGRHVDAVAVAIAPRGGNRMKLSSRRFPDTVTRKRQLPGAFNDFGEFEPGATEEVELRASVQPISLGKV